MKRKVIIALLAIILIATGCNGKRPGICRLQAKNENQTEQLGIRERTPEYVKENAEVIVQNSDIAALKEMHRARIFAEDVAKHIEEGGSITTFETNTYREEVATANEEYSPAIYEINFTIDGKEEYTTYLVDESKENVEKIVITGHLGDTYNNGKLIYASNDETFEGENINKKEAKRLMNIWLSTSINK